ncbi:progesterone receptor isoform X1 [Dasypus novemcinctus]|uniref:progesterone receptor isoform X1 n=1 Tax=Dasypus novemcinctus TaxID=9361 RepID=UPI00265F875D|nr:progesterone receptor isoform X1 [Dasypus novemcinctus]
MTESKAKDPRTPHVAGGAPSPAQAGSPRRGRLDAGPFPASRAADASPVASAGPSLDGLLFPRPCPGPTPAGTKAQEPPPRAPVEGAYPGLAAAGSAGGGGPRPAEKDAGLLDSVLDTLLAAPGPAVCEATGPWCLFGPELPEEPRAFSALMSRPAGKTGDGLGPAAASRGLPRGLSPSRPLLAPTPGGPQWPGAAARAPAVELEEDDGSEAEGPAGPLLKGKARAPGGPAGGGGAAGSAAPGPREDPRFSAPQDAPARSPLAASLLDFLHVPLLPLNPAFLAARTRQLLEDEAYEAGPAGALAAPRASPSALSPPGAAGDFPDCAYPADAEPKDDAFPLYGDFPPPALKIKEEEGGAEAAAARSPRPSAGALADCPAAPPPPRAPAPRPGEAASPAASALECVLYKAEGAAAQAGPFAPPPGKAAGLLPRDGPHPGPAAGPAPPLYPALGLNGLPALGYPAAVLKEGLPQVYPPYLNYLRPDSEASQSPQYSFESLPQKICLICGDEASGCHYGVLTCGSCKVFFKRAMEGQHNYLCAGRNDCIVDKIRRKNCPACRLRKCCQAGMVLGGRKFKKFNKVRVMRALDAVALPQAVGIPNESQALSQRITFTPSQEVQFIPSLVNLLMSIEPDVIYAGHDNSKPDTSSSLLTSLNQLAERQLLSVVKWSKALPGFRNLHIDDQITLIQYSWMSLMVFGLGWRSYKHVSGQMLYFAPDLILNEQRMKELSFYSLCLTMWQIPQEFVKLQVSQEEFLCMKVLLLLNTIPLEGLRSQNQFEEMRSSYIRELIKAIGLRQKGVVSSSQRFYQLTKLLDNLHDLVKQLHLYCLNTFIQSRALSVEFPEMMSEVIAAQLPKILAGMVKPLLFHKK